MHKFHSLPYLDRATQMQTDGMNTMSDVIGNILDLISGKSDGAKVRNCERQHNRFEKTWSQAGSKRNADSDVIERPPKKQKKSQPNDHLHGIPTNNTSSDTSESTVLLEAPWLLKKQKLNIADSRVKSLKYPRGFDYTPADHFSRQWTLQTMHGKQRCVTQKTVAWFLRGLLGRQQEETLFFLFNVIRRRVQPTYTQEEIPQLITDTHLAVTLLERDFPLSLQNLTTHLLHHIPEGFMDFGPYMTFSCIRWNVPIAG